MKNLNKILKLTTFFSVIFMVSCSSQYGIQNSTAILSQLTTQKIIVSGNRLAAQTLEIAIPFLAMPVSKGPIMPKCYLKREVNIADLIAGISSSAFIVDVDSRASFNTSKIIRHGYYSQKDVIRFDELVEKPLFLLRECVNKTDRIAKENIGKKATNRKLMMNDADFNVAINDLHWLLALTEDKGQRSTFLELLKYGTDDYRDYLKGQHVNQGFGMPNHIGSIFKELREILAFNTVVFSPGLVNLYWLYGDKKLALEEQYFSRNKTDSGEITIAHYAASIHRKTSPNWSSGSFFRGQS